MDGEITPDRLDDLRDADDPAPLIVDVRQPAPFRRGHIHGSENVPLPELPARADELAGADRVVTVCPHGKASVKAARLVAAHEGSDGATVESLAGGLTAWRQAGYELVGGSPGSDGDRGHDGPDAPF